MHGYACRLDGSHHANQKSELDSEKLYEIIVLGKLYKIWKQIVCVEFGSMQVAQQIDNLPLVRAQKPWLMSSK